MLLTLKGAILLSSIVVTLLIFLAIFDCISFSSLSIIWMTVATQLSLFFCFVIVSYISKKPPVKKTLIDLIYSDCVKYLYLASFVFYLSISHCLIKR
jgi:hypothetical protein